MVTFSNICSVRIYDDDIYEDKSEEISNNEIFMVVDNKINEVIKHFNKVRIMNKFQVRAIIGNDLIEDVHVRLCTLKLRLESSTSEAIIVSQSFIIKKHLLSLLGFLESATTI